MLCDGRTDNDFKIHLTYESGVDDLEAKFATFFTAQTSAGRTFAVDSPAQGANSLQIDLLDPLPH